MNGCPEGFRICATARYPRGMELSPQTLRAWWKSRRFGAVIEISPLYEMPNEVIMPFTVEEFRDLLRILEERPEWRAELRRLVLTDELLTLPELVRALTEAQQRTGERVAVLEERMAALIAAQQRTGEHVAALEERMAALIEAQQRTEERLAALAEALTALTIRVDGLTRNVSALRDDVSGLKGDALERRHREHAHAYFAPVVRRIRVLGGEELEALLEEAVDQGQLSEAEAMEVLLADLVVRGRRRDDSAEVYLVVEVSWTVDPYDVERAVRRATLLRKTGMPALPVVAGATMAEEAVNLAGRLRVWQVTDGHMVPPQGGNSHSS
jgi:polyhydroxyalkanoate synthesis regulator phasin